MTDTYAKSYAEILEIIKNMEQSYKEKIPSKLLNFFEENKDNSYSNNLNKNQDVIYSQKTIELLAMLELKYLTTEEEKELLKSALEENDKKYQMELREKYNPDNLFKDKESKAQTDENATAMVEYKISIFTKFKNWIKRIFNK